MQQYLGFTAGRCFGQFGYCARQPDCKIQRSGGTVREIDVASRVNAIILLWLSASSSACHGLLIITVIPPLPTKPSATKMPENWKPRTRQLLTCRCQRDVAALDAKYKKELAIAKAENDAFAERCRWSSSVAHIKAVCQSVREATTALAWITQLPPTGRHR